MANPTWFNYEAYMNNKLAQMQATDPNYSLDQLFTDFAKAGFAGSEGAYNHFLQYGADEEVAPNALFSAKEYYVAKAVEYYTKQGVEVTAATISDFQINNVKQLIDQAGMNAWTHYQQFGSSEGVSPSNAFDANAYCAAKAAVMGGTWDAKGIQDAITAAHMTVLEHFMQYAGTGADEITADQKAAGFPVSDADKVPSDVVTKPITLTINPDTVKGTSGDDAINAVLGGLSGTSATLTPGDNIDGGAGTDTLNVYGGDFNGVTMKNVEIVNHAVRGDINVSAFADVKEVWQNAAPTGSTVTAQIATKVGFGGTSAGAQEVKFTKADGTADAAAVALNGVTATSVTVTGGVEAQTLELTGKNVLTGTDGFKNADMTSLVITGDGSLAADVKGKDAVTITADALKSVDASAAKGDLNVSFAGIDGFNYTGSQGADKLTLTGTNANFKETIKLGAGDDKLTLDTAVGKDGSSYDGGDGTADTLVLENIALTKAQSAMFTNFEALTLKAADGTTTYNVTDGISGITSYKVDMAATTGATAKVNVTNIANGTTFAVKADSTGTTNLSLDLSNQAIAKGGTLNLDFNNGETTTAKAGSQIDSFTTNAKVLDITSAGLVTDDAVTHNKLTFSTTSANATVKTINIDGDQAFDLTTGDAAALTKIDGSAATGKLNIDASGMVTATDAAVKDGLTIKGGSADDIIKAADGTASTGIIASTITGGAGADTITLGTAANTTGDKIVLTEQADSTAAAYDVVTNFSTTTGSLDIIDLTAFGFDAELAAGALTNKSAAVSITDITTTDAKFAISATNANGFFKDTTTGAAQSVVFATANDGAGSPTYATFVFIDANMDGNWSADSDSVILLAGVNGSDSTNGLAVGNFDLVA